MAQKYYACMMHGWSWNQLNTLVLMDKVGKNHGARNIVHAWCMVGPETKLRTEGRNVLFNDTLNTFYLWLYSKKPLRQWNRKPTSTITFTSSSVRDREKKGGGNKGGTACTGRYKGVRAVRLESVAGGGWFEVLWNLECPIALSQREICAHFNEGNLVQFGQSTEKLRIVELRSKILI